MVRAADASPAVAGASFNAADKNLYVGTNAWIDEWSRFYVEIWGTSDGNGSISLFSTSFTYDTGYYVAQSVTGGPGFSVSMKEVVGEKGKVVTLKGSATEEMGGEGERILLARVLFAPVKQGGVAIPEDGTFCSYDWRVDTLDAGNSINASADTAVDDQYMDLTLYPVRFDYTDDGAVTGSDFTSFAIDYGKASVSGKFNTIEVTGDGKLTGSDFTTFALAYGRSTDTVVNGLYRDAGIDPLKWAVTPVLSAPSSALLSEIWSDGALLNDDTPELVLGTQPADSSNDDLQAAALMALLRQNAGGSILNDLLDGADDLVGGGLSAGDSAPLANDALGTIPAAPITSEETSDSLSVIPDGEEENDAEEENAPAPLGAEI